MAFEGEAGCGGGEGGGAQFDDRCDEVLAQSWRPDGRVCEGARVACTVTVRPLTVFAEPKTTRAEALVSCARERGGGQGAARLKGCCSAGGGSPR